MRLPWARARQNRNLEVNTPIPQSATNFLERMGWLHLGQSAAGVTVTIENALGVPAIFSAVNFLAGTMASLPIDVYRKKRSGRSEVKTGVAQLLTGAANDETSSFNWLKGKFENVLTGGRGLSYIERTNAGKIVNFWPLDPAKITVSQKDHQRTYEYKSDGKTIKYAAHEILDLAFMLRSDGVAHRGPIATNKDIIGMAIASTNYGSKVFTNGGLPPAVLTGPFSSAAGAQAGSADIQAAMAKRANEGNHVLALPEGHKLESVGFTAEQMQLLELKRFLIVEIARIYSLPPVFLQDLTNGTYSNSEQQDLFFVKHTLSRWVRQAEQEFNLKLFGRGSPMFMKFNVDGLLRGDFATRMEGHSKAIQNGIRTPNEVRDLEDMAGHDSGDELMIQGATVPISNQLKGALDA